MRGTVGKTGPELQAQIRSNVAHQLRLLINGAPGSKVIASGDADIIVLSSRTVGSAGAFKLDAGVYSFSVAAVDLLSQRASASGSAVAQRELLLLDGTYGIGQHLVLSGVADDDVIYTVKAEDLTAAGNGFGGQATPYQMAHNLARKLKMALEADSSAKVSAVVEGAFIKFTAKVGGLVGAFDLS
jgi:phage tail sheath gpL-like